MLIHKTFNRKTLLVFLFLIILIIFLIARLFYLQVFHANVLQKAADRQHNCVITVPPKRGDIYDTTGKQLAVSIPVSSVYAAPRLIDPQKRSVIARELSSILNIDVNEIQRKLNKDKMFLWIKRRINEQESTAIAQKKFEGIGLLKEEKRFYPNGNLASHVLGFVGIDNDGLAGLEMQFDKYLKGAPGWQSVSRDAMGRLILDEKSVTVSPANGFNLILTIDLVIQSIVEKEIESVYNSSRAKSVSIIVMNPQTGEILALANRPTYDPNNVGDYNEDTLRNRIVTDCFEPGSVFKIVATSAALDLGICKMSDNIYCENGQYAVRKRILHDHTPHGNLSFKDVIAYSSNIGTVKIALKIGEKALFNYIKAFGFGRRTGVDLPGERNGFFYDLKNWSHVSITALPIGHEISATGIQVVTAMSVVANGGKLVKPMILKKILTEDQKKCIEEKKPIVVRQVIKKQTADSIREALSCVVKYGTAKWAALDGYEAGGKTGTAQKLDENNQYSHRKFFSSFVGFAPKNSPKIVVGIFIDEPKGRYYGGTVAAPVFKNIANSVLRYLEFKE